MHTPFLIVVTGRPASGKTTLAHHLAKAIRCPVLCRDEFKEGKIHTLGASVTSADHDRLNRDVYDTFFQTIALLLRNGITLVAEAAFQHQRWQPQLQPLQHFAQIRLIVCSLDPLLARARYVARGLADPERVRYHGGAGVQPTAATESLIRQYEAPQLDAVPLLTVDTANGYSPTIEQIKQFALQPQATW